MIGCERRLRYTRSHGQTSARDSFFFFLIHTIYILIIIVVILFDNIYYRVYRQLSLRPFAYQSCCVCLRLSSHAALSLRWLRVCVYVFFVSVLCMSPYVARLVHTGVCVCLCNIYIWYMYFIRVSDAPCAPPKSLWLLVVSRPSHLALGMECGLAAKRLNRVCVCVQYIHDCVFYKI